MGCRDGSKVIVDGTFPVAKVKSLHKGAVYRRGGGEVSEYWKLGRHLGHNANKKNKTDIRQ